MPDICDLILDDHEVFRRRFAELDELRGSGAGADQVAAVWSPLAELLDVHASAEEAIFYPTLLEVGVHADDETTDAIGDHNEIRDAAHAARRAAPGSDAWWQHVDDARKRNSQHMAEEERGALADLRANAPRDLRQELGNRWVAYHDAHAGGRGIEARDKEPHRYVESHR